MYAIVFIHENKEAKLLPPGTSAQLAELISLTQALELGKGKRLAIYTDPGCLSGATCTCSHLERKGHLTNEGPLNQVW